MQRLTTQQVSGIARNLGLTEGNSQGARRHHRTGLAIRKHNARAVAVFAGAAHIDEMVSLADALMDDGLSVYSPMHKAVFTTKPTAHDLRNGCFIVAHKAA